MLASRAEFSKLEGHLTTAVEDTLAQQVRGGARLKSFRQGLRWVSLCHDTEYDVAGVGCHAYGAWRTPCGRSVTRHPFARFGQWAGCLAATAAEGALHSVGGAAEGSSHSSPLADILFSFRGAVIRWGSTVELRCAAAWWVGVLT